MQNKMAEIEYYDRYEEDLQMDLSKQVYQDMFDLIEFQKLEPSYILEVGCGKGGFGRRMAKVGHRVLGIDLNPKIVNKAQKEKTQNYDVLLGDIEDPTLFEQGTFDVIFCGCILHHLPSIEKAIRNCNCWLKEGGIMLIIEPNGSNPINCLSNIVGTILRRFEQFSRNIGTKNEVSLRCGYLYRTLRNNGFRVLFNKPYIFFFSEEVLSREVTSLPLRIGIAIKNYLFKIGWKYFPEKNKGITMIVKANKTISME